MIAVVKVTAAPAHIPFKWNCSRAYTKLVLWIGFHEIIIFLNCNLSVNVTVCESYLQFPSNEFNLQGQSGSWKTTQTLTVKNKAKEIELIYLYKWVKQSSANRYFHQLSSWHKRFKFCLHFKRTCGKYDFAKIRRSVPLSCLCGWVQTRSQISFTIKTGGALADLAQSSIVPNLRCVLCDMCSLNLDFIAFLAMC